MTGATLIGDLRKHEEDEWSEYNEDERQSGFTWAQSLRQFRGFLYSLKPVLVVSLFLNASLVFYVSSTNTRTIKVPERSPFAGLERNVPRPWTPLEAHNDTEQDALWDSTSYDLGNIALSDDYAKSMGLPRAQRFPWDDSKGIYLINAYHNIHCVHTIRTALVEFRDGKEQSSAWGHIAHCLLVLRDEAMCNADDVPRYTGFQKNSKSGQGQYRMCRDFSKLEDWARQHTACWRHVGEMHDPGFRELDRYRFCPEGSPYKEDSETKWLDGSTDWWRKYKGEQDEA
ncbi:hypothetical protein BDV96DRAFT_600289 [Lophiotrema nucula]|uniref:Cyclochlorotine biosynthesis protein O n=1 Tax=Lophiotrema nucula TaxID=690887 RepID=A0A6A5Z5L1_9PLEO|nr:hypothetical protein BDV96DRAFT_600289 [Lophiotrema nucula]